MSSAAQVISELHRVPPMAPDKAVEWLKDRGVAAYWSETNYLIGNDRGNRCWCWTLASDGAWVRRESEM